MRGAGTPSFELGGGYYPVSKDSREIIIYYDEYTEAWVIKSIGEDHAGMIYNEYTGKWSWL